MRIFNKKNNSAQADLIILDHEEIDETKPLTIFHPTYTWKTHTFENYYVEKMLKPLFIDGELVREKKTVMQYREDSIRRKK